MSSTMTMNAAVDRARDLLCRECARLLASGAFTIRVRIIQLNGKPIEARLYSHRDRRWEIQPERIVDPELLAALQVTLRMLASKPHRDAWSAKERTAADYHDTEIRFHGKELQHRLDDKLEGELRSVLYGDRHDSKHDVRRSIRRRRT